MKEKKDHEEFETPTVPLIYLNLVNNEILRQIRSGRMNLTSLSRYIGNHPNKRAIYEWTLKIRERTGKGTWTMEDFIAYASEKIYRWAKHGKNDQAP